MRISDGSSDVCSSDLRDGSFGSVTAEGPGAFTPEEIAAIEGHHFPRLEAVYWREGSPDFASVAALIGSLDTRPDHIRLRAAAQALDLTLLKRLADAADRKIVV